MSEEKLQVRQQCNKGEREECDMQRGVITSHTEGQ